MDADGGNVREDKVLIEPDALVVWFARSGAPVERIGLSGSPLCRLVRPGPLFFRELAHLP